MRGRPHFTNFFLPLLIMYCRLAFSNCVDDCNVAGDVYATRNLLQRIGVQDEAVLSQFQDEEMDIEALMHSSEKDWQILGLKLGFRKKLKGILDRLQHCNKYQHRHAPVDMHVEEEDMDEKEEVFTQEFNFLQRGIEFVRGTLLGFVNRLFDSVTSFFEWTGIIGRQPDKFCRSIRAQRKWLFSQDPFSEYQIARQSVLMWVSAQRCARLRQSIKKMLLLLHPDKFDQIHPQCPKGSSVDLSRLYIYELAKFRENCRGL